MSRLRRRIGFVVILLAAVLGATASISLLTARPAPTPPASFAPDPSSTTEDPAGDVGVRAFKDFSVLPGSPPESPGSPLQSRLWTIDGRWWAAMVEPVSRETRIYELSEDGSTWSDTKVLLDHRAGAVVDTLWSDSHLYVASAVPGRSTSNGVRVSRFSRDPSGRFVLDPNFPVQLSERGVLAVSIARDTKGRLWAAFVQDGRVTIAYSADDEAVWVPAKAIAVAPATLGPSDVAALIRYGSGRMGLVWTAGSAQSVLFSSRADGDAPESWSDQEVAFAGLPLADEAISLATRDDGSIVVAVETAVPDEPNPSTTDPADVIITRDPAGAWSSALVARVEDRLGGLIVLVDDAASQLYVLATTPRRGGSVQLKRAENERLQFTTGRGLAVIADPSNPAIAFLTSTKGPIDLAAGFVVLGFDRTTGLYWHAVISRATGTTPSPSAPPSGSGSPSAPPSAPATGPTALFTDNFDPWPLNATIDNGWALAPVGASGSLTAIADSSKAGRIARLVPAAAETIRACKSFAKAPASGLVAEVRVRLEAIGGADAVITSLRGPSGEAASVRFGQGGTFAYYSGETKIRTTVANKVGVWLRSAVTLHPESGTYDWRLGLDDGTLVVRARAIPFRLKAAKDVDEICLQTSDVAKKGLQFDDVRISR